MSRAVRSAVAWVLIASGALVSSCGAPMQRPDAPVTVQSDTFDKAVSVTGPETAINWDNGVGVRYRLRSFVTKDQRHDVLHQLYADFAYDRATEHYQSAADDTATSLKLRRITSAGCGRGGPKGDCMKDEAIGIEISDDMLRQRALTGYRVKVTARGGDREILTMTPLMIQKQLSVVDEIIDGASPAPAPDRPRLGIAWIAASARPFDGAPRGLIAVAVGAGTPAAAAGIKPGDVLAAIDGQPVRVYADVLKALEGRSRGGAATLALERDRQAFTAIVHL
jgi:hypothetical protein